MSTTSTISVLKQENDQVLTTRCQYDGYLSGVGNTLKKYFKNEHEILDLVKHKELRSVMEVDGFLIVEPYKDPIDTHQRFDSLEEYFYELDREPYNYIFIDGEWFTFDGRELKELE